MQRLLRYASYLRRALKGLKSSVETLRRQASTLPATHLMLACVWLSRMPIRLPFIGGMHVPLSGSMAPVSPVHEQMHEWTKQEQQVR